MYTFSVPTLQEINGRRNDSTSSRNNTRWLGKYVNKFPISILIKQFVLISPLSLPLSFTCQIHINGCVPIRSFLCEAYCSTDPALVEEGSDGESCWGQRNERDDHEQHREKKKSVVASCHHCRTQQAAAVIMKQRKNKYQLFVLEWWLIGHHYEQIKWTVKLTTPIKDLPYMAYESSQREFPPFWIPPSCSMTYTE